MPPKLSAKISAFQRVLSVGLFAAPFALMLLAVPPAPAQQFGSDQFQQQNQQRQQQQSGGETGATDSAPQQPMVLRPAVSGYPDGSPPSRLEQILSQRAGARLKQFGYDQLSRGRDVTVPQTGRGPG